MGEQATGAEPPRPRVSRRVCIIICSVALLILIAIAIPVFFWFKTSTDDFHGPCHANLSVPILNGTANPDGSIEHRGVVYPAGFHYLGDGGVPMGCVCKLKPCIRKCCAEDEVFFKSPKPVKYKSRLFCNKTDTPSFQNFSMPVFENATQEVEVGLPLNYFTVLYGDVCYHGKFLLNPARYKTDKHFLLKDGKILQFSKAGKELIYDTSLYCLESINGKPEIYTFTCVQKKVDIEKDAMFFLYPLGMILSMPFLVATFVVYAVISELRNLHGMCLMCQVATLFVAYFALTVVQLYTKIPFEWCVALSFVIQFSFLATFFWLNVMCFDIWWVFSGLRPLRGSAKEREHKKFIFYSLYAWGGPLIIFIISIVMELVESIPDTYIKPRFGVDKCWFKDANAVALYFYLPIGVLVLLNIVMFMTTACRLIAHRKDTKVLHGKESHRNDDSDRQRFNLYLKLFIVMGINWVMELVSFIIGGPKSIWFVTDLGNTLQGLLIFLIFVWKRRILRLLNQKLCPRWDLVARTSSTTRSKVSSSRTSSSTISKTVSANPDGLALKPIARTVSEESD